MARAKTTAKKTASKKSATKAAKSSKRVGAKRPASAAKRSAASAERTGKKSDARDPRLPAAGTVLERKFKDKTYAVKVFDDDFEFRGRRYRSLSGIAKEITGAQTNGFLWFNLIPRAKAERASAASE